MSNPEDKLTLIATMLAHADELEEQAAAIRDKVEKMHIELGQIQMLCNHEDFTANMYGSVTIYQCVHCFHTWSSKDV